MELVSVGLFGYQRFEDDFGDMDVTGSPVAIVGPNEAGKTSFLEALEHLNGAGAFSQRNSTRGYEGETCVRARFALDPDDLEAIASAGGLGQPRLLEIAKRSSSEAIRWTLRPALERDLEPRKKALAAAGKVRRGKWLKEREPEEDDPTLTLLEDTLAVLELDSPTLTDSQLEGVSRHWWRSSGNYRTPHRRWSGWPTNSRPCAIRNRPCTRTTRQPKSS